MFIALVIILVLLSAILHELAHAFWMHRYGVTIHEIGLGIPVPGLTLSVTWRNIRWRLSPLVIAAFVKADEAHIRRLPWRHQADICGAGIWANTLFGFTCLLTVSLMTGTWRNPWLLVAAGVISCFPRLFARYIVPVAGVPLLLLNGYFIYQTPSDAMGPVGIVGFISEHAVHLPAVLALAGLLSILIGAFNLLPLMPLDAGRTLDILLRRRWPVFANIVANSGGLILLLLIAFVFANDIGRLFS